MARLRIQLACASAFLVQACAAATTHRMAAPAMPSTPVAAPAPARPQTFHGVYRFGFEVSSFERCYLSMSGESRAEFERRHPEIAETRSSGGVYEYDIAFEGTRREGPSGHMRAQNCEYAVTRLGDSRRIPFRSSP